MPNAYRKKPLLTILIVTCAFTAALGTMPYGYHFAHILEKYSHSLFLLMGVAFALAALLSNAALGAYSLLNAKLKQDLINPYFLAIGSFISAIPNGFICYFGYRDSLPFLVDLLISVVVVIVNAGIAYTAIHNFLADIFHKPFRQSTFQFHFASKTGFVAGLLVSTTFYMVTVYGLTYVLSLIIRNRETAFYLACVLGIISWIPGAALYSNSTRITSEKVYEFIEQSMKRLIMPSGVDLVILLIAVGSGASFCQIAIEFFDPSKDIPSFVKNDLAQTFVYHCIVPCAFSSSAAVNYLALKRLYTSLTSSPRA